MKKIASVLFSILLCSLVFTACAENTTCAVVKNGVSEYSIVYAEGCGSLTVSAAEIVRDGINDAAGVSLPLESDTAEAGACEILIGVSDRSRSQTAFDALGDASYSVAVDGGCVIIVSSSENGIEEAARYFVDTYVKGAGTSGGSVGQGTLTLPASALYVGRISPAGNISDYTVVYSSDAGENIKAAADGLCADIGALTGVTPTAAVDNTDADGKSGPLIIIGDTKISGGDTVRAKLTDADCFIIEADGKQIFIMGSNDTMLDNGIKYFSSNYLSSDPAELESLQFYSGQLNTARDGWQLLCPPYDGGTLDTTRYNCGEGLISSKGTNYLQLINETTLEEYNAYIGKMKALGYRQTYQNQIENNYFTGFYDEAKKETIYAYYYKNVRQAKVVRDTLSDAMEDINYACSGDARTTFYQYAINCYDGSSGGAFFLIRLSDGSWIVIDGGDINHAGDNFVEGLDKFMREKSGLAAGEKITVACWYITHGHKDHFVAFARYLKKYHDSVDIKSVMFNFSSDSVMSSGSKSDVQTLRARIASYYPDVKYIKQHTGMKFTFGDVTMEFIYTQEDHLYEFYLGKSNTAYADYKEYNDTTSMCMISFNGIKIFSMGDATRFTCGGDFSINNTPTITPFYRCYSKATYGCDILLVAHHGFSGISSIYKNLSNYYACFNNAYAASVGDNKGSSKLVSQSSKANYFTDKYIYGFSVDPADGKIVITEDEVAPNTKYTGSDW